MINVNWTAKTIKEGIDNMMSGAKADYERFATNNFQKKLEPGTYAYEQFKDFLKRTTVSMGKKYAKVLQGTGVFAFIVLEDFKHFKKGDILKPAGYNKPALNSARGNVFNGNYMIEWTGPLYMDSHGRLR